MGKRFEWSDHQCNRWCKVHRWWDFDFETFRDFPMTRNILTSTHGWLQVEVWSGPPAYYPKKAK